ncbi:hypothetical protein BDN70DRAFT_424489 [Pholiota conissans]|uniref:BTB domain-containing protein n=1 Tax=Pholiota conissans TaxID=109636 RepID=A0A9P5YQK4_9AGAR|nr:hypothetical protein BDN70DRAFT_424489 [Pholiota conissans]
MQRFSRNVKSVGEVTSKRQFKNDNCVGLVHQLTTFLNLNTPDAMESEVCTAISQTRFSSLFNASDADITFISSDHVLFKVHSAYLSLNSMSFVPVGDHIFVEAEPVALQEPSDVLEIIFQFIEPPTESRNFRQPDVDDLLRGLFFRVAEAAEKYVVYSAITVCLSSMRRAVEEYPFEILNHCARHGYSDLADKAALILVENLDTWTIEDAARKLRSPGVFARFMVYYSTLAENRKRAVNHFEMNAPWENCEFWTYLLLLYRQQVEKNMFNIRNPPLEEISLFDIEHLKCDDYHCTCHSLLARSWPAWFYANLNEYNVPFFSAMKI